MKKYTYLREEAYKGNMELPTLGLVIFTWGNVSFADQNEGIFAIKPSGVPYNNLKEEDLVIVDFDGKIVDGKLRPSSDTATHAVLYQNWKNVQSIVHTHSTYATAWAQAQKDIPILGTTHADHNTYDIPCAAPMSDEMIKGNYEQQTGFQILNELAKRNIEPNKLEMILVGNHGPFTWGATVQNAIYNSAVLENIAQMAHISLQINKNAPRLKDSLIQKHYDRKHGSTSYYGQ